jgi:hypothetical protein
MGSSPETPSPVRRRGEPRMSKYGMHTSRLTSDSAMDWTQVKLEVAFMHVLKPNPPIISFVCSGEILTST